MSPPRVPSPELPTPPAVCCFCAEPIDLESKNYVFQRQAVITNGVVNPGPKAIWHHHRCPHE